MKTKTLVLFLIVVSLAFSTGCWDYKEYESLAMVSAVGFDCDSTANKITVTLQYLVPGGSSQSGGGSPKSSAGSTVVKAEGTSIDDAFTKIQQAVGKNLFFGYMQEVVIGESAAKKITMDIIGYFDRSPNIRTAAYIAVTPQNAEDVLIANNPNISESPAKNIHNLIDQSLNTGNAYPVSIQDFEEDLVKGGVEAVAPKILTITSSGAASNSSSSSSGTSSGTASGSSSSSSGTSSGAASSSSSSSSGTSSGTTSGSSRSSSSSISTPSGETSENNNNDVVVLNEQKKGYFKVDGMAVFHGEELAGWFDESQSVGLGFIRGQKLNNYEIVKTSTESEISNSIVYRITSSKSKIKIELKDDKPVAYIDVYVEADLRKFAKNVNADFFTPKVIDMLNKKLADNVKNELSDSLHKGQKELKTDAFGVGFNFYRQYPKSWHSKYEKSWNKVFPDMQINLNVTGKVIDTGTNIQKAKSK